MNRRTFIQAAATTTLSGLTARVGIGGTGQSVEGLLKWLEQSRREDVPRDATRLIRGGLRYEDLLTALCLAAVRNVQPYPDAGAALYMWLGARRCATHGTAGGRPSNSLDLRRPLVHGGP